MKMTKVHRLIPIISLLPTIILGSVDLGAGMTIGKVTMPYYISLSFLVTWLLPVIFGLLIYTIQKKKITKVKAMILSFLTVVITEIISFIIVAEISLGSLDDNIEDFFGLMILSTSLYPLTLLSILVYIRHQQLKSSSIILQIAIILLLTFIISVAAIFCIIEIINFNTLNTLELFFFTVLCLFPIVFLKILMYIKNKEKEHSKVILKIIVIALLVITLTPLILLYIMTLIKYVTSDINSINIIEKNIKIMSNLNFNGFF